jgi:D-alanyl-D-alanine carboxypeptidase
VTTLPEITFKSETKYIHKIKNTNIIIEKIPNLFFSKTGFTTLAGGNLTVVFENKAGHILAITLLGSTKEGRFSDMGKLVEIANTLQ